LPEKYIEIQSISGNTEFVDKIPLDLIRKLGHRIIEKGVKILLIKMGHRGAYLLTGDVSSMNEKLGTSLQEETWNNREILCNAYKVDQSKVMHATGAGDTAVAAFLSAILNGETPDAAIKLASIAGRESLYCETIFTDIGSWEQLIEKINNEPNELVLF